tara:strand:+ start:3167 stop:3379 length:213 start_codon:yes stop_codon:yes gene_type:complete
MDNYKKAYKIYEKHGQDAVLKAVNKGELEYDSYKYCTPCEWTSPIWENTCLVCGTINENEFIKKCKKGSK